MILKIPMYLALVKAMEKGTQNLLETLKIVKNASYFGTYLHFGI